LEARGGTPRDGKALHEELNDYSNYFSMDFPPWKSQGSQGDLSFQISPKWASSICESILIPSGLSLEVSHLEAEARYCKLNHYATDYGNLEVFVSFFFPLQYKTNYM
jgi:hypothetical protein